MRFKLVVLSAWIAMALLTGCQERPDSGDDPKHRLNDYISQSFAVKAPQDRRELANFLTGEARARIEGWSDEQFRQAFIDTKRQFVKLAFKEQKAVSAEEVSITYELTYQSNYSDLQGKTHDAKVTNRKLAQMVRENGKWFIKDVRNIKELVEYHNELSLP